MTLFDHYHDLAAQLLGRDGFPLPLPNMDRNYPHNIGLLSDAEESALAAAVLQLTNGMSYESWKVLDMDQRVPWMEQAVKKAGADNRSNGLTRAEVIADLVNRGRAGMNVVTADDVAGWPKGLLEQFVVDGILTPAANAKSIACDACGDDHVEPVQFVEAPPGSPLRAYITCPDNGRVQVPLDRLRCWRVNVEATPNAKSAEAGSPEFKLPNRPGRTFPRKTHPRRPKSTKCMKPQTQNNEPNIVQNPNRVPLSASPGWELETKPRPAPSGQSLGESFCEFRNLKTEFERVLPVQSLSCCVSGSFTVVNCQGAMN